MKTWDETFMGDYLYLPKEEQEKIEREYKEQLEIEQAENDKRPDQKIRLSQK